MADHFLQDIEKSKTKCFVTQGYLPHEIHLRIGCYDVNTVRLYNLAMYLYEETSMKDI